MWNILGVKGTKTMKLEETILETIPGTTHKHINEVGGFTVTDLVAEVKYELVSNKYYTEYRVTGLDENGTKHGFLINKAAINMKESRFCGYL